MPQEQSFAERLVGWQRAAGRHDLPWQRTRDPYRVWLSEIMLQQTQVATVIPYYARFLEAFPDVAALAAAPAEQVLALWAGLGYYARARNLHRCAQQVVAVHGGFFPKTAAGLAELPGIGRSTAAAVAAFCYAERTAILDGNVKRVLCRVFGIDGFPGSTAVDRKLWALAETLLPEAADDMPAYTQGLMDLGATLCTRGLPHCPACPFADVCVARRDGRQRELPAPKPRAAVPERESTFVLIVADNRLLLERRPPAGLWGGLLVPPEGEPEAVLAARGLLAVDRRELPFLKHAFTHFRLTLKPVLCRVASQGKAGLAEPGGEWIELERAAEAGVPTPIRKLISLVANPAD
ncbi:A/G-specific adenine glycosylase [Azonexus sp. R2A61]|uniref:A/G-specific adenine glycosylase n=1 Tax=Azonexus sp. R2A61 TaxID=2744443 RepID=UPI001F212872|nr:A/G-specific adenine glycosylase [Azonexus sp. R2A61]